MYTICCKGGTSKHFLSDFLVKHILVYLTVDWYNLTSERPSCALLRPCAQNKMCVSVLYVCICVCEREREKERERVSERVTILKLKQGAK